MWSLNDVPGVYLGCLKTRPKTLRYNAVLGIFRNNCFIQLKIMFIKNTETLSFLQFSLVLNLGGYLGLTQKEHTGLTNDQYH